MLYSEVSLPSETIARKQFNVLNQLGDLVRLSEDDRCRALDLSDRDWRAWKAFLNRNRFRAAGYEFALKAERGDLAGEVAGLLLG